MKKSLENAVRGSNWLPLLSIAGAVLVVGAVCGAALMLLSSESPPGDDSAEAGFARDMIVHHAQAVEMATLAWNRTEDERIRTLATDIVLTQQAQIGQMQGWLAIWDLPATGTEPAMSWMGHPTEGRMPGMASSEEIEELSEASSEEADLLFLQLMIPHHEAALSMSDAVLERSDQPVVEQLATAIRNSQESEIAVMRNLLGDRGASPEENEHSHSGEEAHDHS